MRLVLIDTGPLVALCRPSDNLHSRAMNELGGSSSREPLQVCVPVLTETFFFLKTHVQRLRLRALLSQEIIALCAPPALSIFENALRWMEQYADHQPDFADAYLLTLADALEARIWTFDKEFRVVWKTLGKKNPSLVKARSR